MFKKIGIGICTIIVLAVVVLFAYRFIMLITPDDGSAMRENVNYLNNEVDLSFLLYGEDINFPKELEYEKISSLDSENWQKDNDYVYLIINDLNGTVEFEKDEFIQMMEYADKNTNFNFYYIGTDKLDMIEENVVDSNLNDDDMSFGYVMYEGYRIVHLGLWSKNDHQYIEKNKGLLAEVVYTRVLANVKSNE